MSQERKKQEENFVRILGTDINAKSSLLYGFSKIKGVSFTFSNALCHVLKLDKNAKIAEISDADIEKVENFLTNPKKEGIPEWMLNQRLDNETGENLHINGKDIDFNLLQTKRRLAKTKSYIGLRLRLGLPVRGQRTKANFRRNKTLAAMKSKSIGKK